MKVVGVGTYKAAISFKVNNPDNESIVSAKVKTNDYSSAGATKGENGEYTFNVTFSSSQKEYTLTPVVEVYTGDRVKTEILGESVTVTKQEAECSWDVVLDIGISKGTVTASLKDFYFVDQNSISSARFYYKAKDAQTYQNVSLSRIASEKTGQGTLQFTSGSLNLKAGTEYEWYVEVQEYSEYTYIKTDVATFKTEDEFELTEEHIPDANLRALLLSKVSADKLTNANVETITYIYSSSYNDTKIRNLTGIKYAKNLTSLTFSGHDFSSGNGLDEIKELKKLQSLSLYGCNLNEIPELTGLEKLTSITLSENNLTNLSGIEKAENIQYLTVDECNISDVSAVLGLKKIEGLSLRSNQLT